MKRFEKNPIIVPNDVKPSHEDFVVEGVFNAGAVKFNGEYLLLLRIAESVKTESGFVGVPIMKSGKMTTLIFDKSDEKYSFDDSRAVQHASNLKTAYLTSFSHIRLARSKDGFNFTIDEKPFFIGETIYEEWGVEDPRVIEMDGEFIINYTSVSKYGASTSMITTKDFVSYEHKGIMFLPENKDVCLFPEKINNRYYTLCRPVPKAFGTPNMYISSSDNLIDWGRHEFVAGTTEEDTWDNGRIGGGAPMIKIEEGWLQIYHAADKDNRYCLGLMLFDKDNPQKLIAKSKAPIFEPEEVYEIEGFFGNVVFTCGAILEDDHIKVYYGAADDKMGIAILELSEVKSHLGV